MGDSLIDIEEQKSQPDLEVSRQQQRLWILDQLEDTGGLHNIHVCLRIQGSVSVKNLEKSLTAVNARHDVLRSRFIEEKDGLHAVAAPVYPISLLKLDLRSLPQAGRKAAFFSRATAELRQRFDIESGPLLRATLYQIEEQEYWLLLVLHRIVCDSWSARLLVKEIVELYSSALGASSLSTARQFAEFTAWEREYLAGESARADMAYWKEHLKGSPEGTELPFGNPRPNMQSFRGAERSLKIDGEHFGNLKRLCVDETQPPFVIVLAAFVFLLARYTGSEDILIGSETRERRDEGKAPLIGPVSNLFAMRTHCGDNPTFREMARRVGEVLKTAEEHASLPFATLLEALHPSRDRSRNPLFQVVFTRQGPDPVLEMPGIACEILQLETGTEGHDLRVEVIESTDGIQFRFSFATDLFEAASIERMMGHYRTLLGAVASDPTQTISQLPIMTATESEQIRGWNDTRRAYPTDVPLHVFIEQQVDRTPDAIAVVFRSQQLTYRQFNERANQLAHYLRRQGVGEDTLVGVSADRSIEMVVALVGIVKAGGAYVPLDPDYPDERLEGMLDDASPLLVLTQRHLRDRVSGRSSRVLCLDSDRELLLRESTANLEPVVTGKSLAYVIYTSGSTGKPKGVPNVHEGVVNRLLWMQDEYKLTPADRVLQKTPYSFDVSVWEFFWPLMTGAKLIVADPGGHKDPAYLSHIIAARQVTTMHFVPSMLSIFLDAGDAGQCKSLKRVFVSGEALPHELQQRFFQKLPTELHNLYGPTEAAVDVTYWKCRPDDLRTIVPIGHPVANTQIHILDRNLQPNPIGIPGELHIGGIQLARGYLNRPKLTAEKFVPDPFSGRDGRLYKTGDLARFLSDGSIEYLGRIDHQVKLRGFRIELGEIEAVLGELKGIRQVVVTLRKDPPAGKRLVAYIVTSREWSSDFAEVRAHLKKKLPEFMVPSKFVVLDAFPMTGSGKVDRKALPAPAIEREDRIAMAAPVGETEILIVSLFQKILGVTAVSTTDDFFDLGGHSLLAARMLAEIRQATGKQIPLSQLFLGASPEYLARIVQDGIDHSDTETVTLIQPGTTGAAFFAIVPPGEEALGYAMLARHMGRNQTVYKVQAHAPVVRGRPYTEQEMRAMGQEYAAAIVSVQSEGPYCMGGLCDGTHIAERVILELEAQDREVGLFAIFDTWTLQYSQRPWLWRLYYYLHRLHEIRRLGLSKQFESFAGAVANKIGKLTGKSHVRNDWPQAYWPKDFVPQRFGAPVALFKRPKQPFYYIKDREMGWAARSAGGVEIHEIPFDHDELLREPHVRTLGEELAACIERVSQRTSIRPQYKESSSESTPVAQGGGAG